MRISFLTWAIRGQPIATPTPLGVVSALAALALTACTPGANSPSQIATGQASDGKGGLFAFHTGPASGCPGLDWHVVVQPGGQISGMVGWDNMAHTANLSGNMAPDGAFTGKALEVASGRTGNIAGRAAGNYIAISISGTGTPCDNVVLNVPRSIGGYAS
jgi:hypothetical protein